MSGTPSRSNLATASTTPRSIAASDSEPFDCRQLYADLHVERFEYAALPARAIAKKE